MLIVNHAKPAYGKLEGQVRNLINNAGKLWTDSDEDIVLDFMV